MARVVSFEPRFCDEIPESLDQGLLYISMEYCLAIHLCACGCGNKVVTPLSVAGWTLTFNGKASLSPSIGNWSFKCQSHYWIKKNNVDWAAKLSNEQIARGRALDRFARTNNTSQEREPQVKDFPAKNKLDSCETNKDNARNGGNIDQAKSFRSRLSRFFLGR